MVIGQAAPTPWTMVPVALTRLASHRARNRVLPGKRNGADTDSRKKAEIARRVIDRPPSFVGWRSNDEGDRAPASRCATATAYGCWRDRRDRGGEPRRSCAVIDAASAPLPMRPSIFTGPSASRPAELAAGALPSADTKACQSNVLRVPRGPTFDEAALLGPAQRHAWQGNRREGTWDDLCSTSHSQQRRPRQRTPCSTRPSTTPPASHVRRSSVDAIQHIRIRRIHPATESPARRPDLPRPLQLIEMALLLPARRGAARSSFFQHTIGPDLQCFDRSGGPVPGALLA